MNFKIGFFTLSVISISACSSANGKLCNEQVALNKGKQLIQDKFPRSYQDSQPIVISKGNGFWRINGTLPKGVAGGVPKVKLDLKSCKLLDIYHTQ